MVVSAVETWNEDVHTLPYVSEMDARRPAGNPEGAPAVKRGSQNDGDRGLIQDLFQFFDDTKVLFCIFSLDFSKYLFTRFSKYSRNIFKSGEPVHGGALEMPRPRRKLTSVVTS